MTHNPAAQLRDAHIACGAPTACVLPPCAELHAGCIRCVHSVALELLAKYIPQLDQALSNLVPVDHISEWSPGMEDKVCRLRDDGMVACFGRQKLEQTVAFMRGKKGVLKCSICM